MKMSTLVLVSIALSLVPNLATSAETPIRTISVSGTVQTKIAPDQVVWHISLKDTSMNLNEAKSKNDTKANAVLALRDHLGIEPGDLETGQLSIRREYERGQHGNQGEFKHFVVTRSITVRQRDLKRFDQFLDNFVASADMEVNFSFESSEMHKVRADTRLLALKAAQEKARAMAEAVGAKLGPVVTINEHPETSRWQNPMSNSAFIQSVPSADTASERFIPGAINVSLTVYTVFELN